MGYANINFEGIFITPYFVEQCKLYLAVFVDFKNLRISGKISDKIEIFRVNFQYIVASCGKSADMNLIRGTVSGGSSGSMEPFDF